VKKAIDYNYIIIESNRLALNLDLLQVTSFLLIFLYFVYLIIKLIIETTPDY